MPGKRNAYLDKSGRLDDNENINHVRKMRKDGFLMKKRLLCLCMTALLLACAYALPAQAAEPAWQALSRVGYYGSVSHCEMSGDMATAYAQVLGSLPGSRYKALLADPADDGLPLLVTAEEDYGFHTLTFWTWDGTRAKAYDFDRDTECGYTFNYMFGTLSGQAALHVGDGVATCLGDACGDLYYQVKGAKLTLLHHTMHYTAETMDGITAQGERLPLVQSHNGQAPVAEMVKAGWLYDRQSQGLYLEKVDGKYLTFQSIQEWLDWTGKSPFPFVENQKQIFEESTGGDTLLGTWSGVEELRRALESYAASEGTFSDVPVSHYAYKPVTWAVERGITNGTSATTFSPNSTCTTGQILTFLWRGSGQPLVGKPNPFSDVGTGDYFYQPALWAHEKGLVSGGTFRGAAPCTRSSAVIYLWKLAGSPAVPGNDPFADVEPKSDEAAAIRWAVREEITNGTSDTTFSPNAICTRGQIVTFLYRAWA